ncbi:MAG: hypothetical protein IJ597_07460 [Synergistaceae bacterium]|nr:hypothetical protein [Synergistaceae bacterium]
MTTITLDMPAEVIKKAEDVFQKKGMSYSQFLRDVTEKAILDFSSSEELPVPCIDDLSEKEIMKLFEKGMESIRAGRSYSSEEMLERIKQYGVEF